MDEIVYRSRYKPFEVMGYWQFDDSEDLIAGRLAYDGHGRLKLDVMMPVEARNSGRMHAPKDMQVTRQAMGVLETGEFAVLEGIRLVDYQTVKSRWSVTESTYRAQSLFAGDLITDTTKFDNVRVKFTGLLEWLNQKPVTQSGDGPGEEITFKYNAPQGPEIDLEDGMSLRVHYPYSTAYSLVPVEEFVIPQPVEIVLGYDALVPLDELYGKAMCFGRLLTLATGARMSPSSFRACIGEYRMGVFGKYPNYDAGTIDYAGFGFLYTDVREHFKEMLDGWFGFYGKHQKSLDLYFETLMEEHHMSQEIVFLRIVQSLEALHLDDHPGKQGLECRLLDLLEINHDILESGTDKKQFVGKVVKTRNYHAHGHIEKHKDDILTDADLFNTTSRLKLVMFAHMIDVLSMSEAVEKKAMDAEIWRQEFLRTRH